MRLQKCLLEARLHHASPEEGMIFTAEPSETNLASNFYRVEVSGWDDCKTFFVENSQLEWNERAGKQITLRRGLRDGAVIFLRLLQPISNDRSRPVAYQAEMVARTEEGQRQFRLHPVSTHAIVRPSVQ